MYMSSSGANGLTPIWHNCRQVRWTHSSALQIRLFHGSEQYGPFKNILEQTAPKVAEKSSDYSQRSV